MANIAALMIPYQYLDKVFLSHLHTDHWGDLDALWAGGWTAGRPKGLEVWGPSAHVPEMGTGYAVEHFLKAFNWDYQTRAFKINPVCGEVIVHEFDYSEEAEMPIVPEFNERYNAFIILCENEIDELNLRNVLQLTETHQSNTDSNTGKCNIITAKRLLESWDKLR